MIGNDSDSDCGKREGGFSAFKENDEIHHLIKQLHEPDLSHRIMEKNQDRFCFILKQYQDQPQLLDPYLEGFLSPLIQFIRERREFDYLKHYVFKYIYIIMSVKTYKKIAIHLPHEVTDFNPVLEMLEKQDMNDKENWQTRYVLLIWLSIISKIPFALSRLETSDPGGESPEKTITTRVIHICKKYCSSKDSCSTAAIFLVAHFLTRFDVKERYLEDMIMWAVKQMDTDKLNHRPLAVLASIIKHSCRDDVAPYTQLIIDKISDNKLDETSADLVRKFSMKIIQRIGISLLKMNITPWRYKKASKAIALSLNQCENSSIEPVTVDKEFSIVENDDHEIPPIMEDILEHLIRGLQDKSIIIRWSAAKGIGRITARLPIDLADDVLGSILNLFSSRESETAWHGGCLALAELGRRGLLLPYRLKDIIPLVIQALVFDEPRAYGPVGSIIRDAACFVCWSFARAFEPHIFEPYVKEVATALLIVTCFDREINCRRAGSAAFQENVGRQGNFPYGIDIISAADYFEVGARTVAYLQVSIHVAKYEGYLKPLVDHLVKRKVTHWDIAIRKLASQALHNLTELDTSYMIKEVLPTLLGYINSIDLFVRHGAILAIAEILVALHKNLATDISNIIDKDDLDKIQSIVTTCQNRGQLRGLGGEVIKQACVTLIKKFALVHCHIKTKTIINDWQSLLEDCLSNEVSIVREVSAQAHTAFFSEYYFSWDMEDRHAIINRYLENLLCSQINRIGFAQAIGYFPEPVLKEKGEDIFKKLIQCCFITRDTLLWAESRKEATNSLRIICETLGLSHADQWKPFVNDMFECLFKGLAEYTTDSRGDIGSWVREAAISGILSLTNLVFEAGYTSVLNKDLMTKIIGGIAQQAVERIDRTRAKAGTAFNALIQSKLPNIPHHEELKTLFSSDEKGKFIDWKSESETFPLFIQMLSFPPYVQDLLKGIIFSVGGLSESLVKHSSMSLFTYLQQLDKETLMMLCQEICNIFESSHGDDRMISASLAFLDRLFSSGCIQSILDDPENEIPRRMLTLLKKESKSINATQSLLNNVKLFCHLLQVCGPVSKGAFSQLSIYLCHKFKYLRKATAGRLYESLTIHGDEMDVSEEDLNVLLTQLNTVDWEKPVEELRPIRNQLCEIMKCPVPVIRPKPQ